MVRHQVVLWPSHTVIKEQDVLAELDDLFDVVSHHDMPPEEAWES